MQNIDKISFVVVAVVVLGLSAYAVVFSGGDNHSEIGKHTETIRAKQNEQEVRSLGRSIPDFKGEIRKDFDLAAAQPFPEWSFYRRPAQVNSLATVLVRAADHVAPMLSRVEVVRDRESKKAVHRVTGQLGESARVKGLKAALESRSEDGDWQHAADIDSPRPGAEFDVVIEAPAGLRYSYRVRSEAESATPLALSPEQAVLYSVESPPLVMPPNYSLAAGGAQTGRPGTGDSWEPARANLKIRYYDYATGEIKQNLQSLAGPNLGQGLETLKDVFPETLGPGWKLYDVKEQDKSRVIELRNVATREKLTLVNNAAGPDLEVKAWDNPNRTATGPEGAGADAEPTTPKPDTPAPPTPAPRRKNPFGDD
ncbi:MAG: hypothetical protein AB7O52_15965 [Planctomycetota bacterium]